MPKAEEDPLLPAKPPEIYFSEKELSEYRKEFLGNVSHELKTPIFNIQGYVLTLLDGGLYDENCMSPDTFIISRLKFTITVMRGNYIS